MRSSELCAMTTGAIDRTVSPWVYRPAHKTEEHHGHEREIYLNAEAQEIVRPFLKMNPHAFLFSPAEAERRERHRAARKTPVQPSQVARAERAKRRGRRRPPGTRYTRETNRTAAGRALEQSMRLGRT